MCVSENIIKKENSLLAIFDEILPYIFALLNLLLILFVVIGGFHYNV